MSLLNSIKNIGSGGNSEEFTLCMQKALSVVRDAVVLVDSKGTIQFLNQNAENLLKCKQRSVLSKNFWELYSLLDSKTQRPVKNNILAGVTSPVAEDYLLVVSQHQELSTNILISPISFLANRPDKLSYALVIQDTSEKKILESKLNYLGSYDDSTRLPNRKSIEITLKHALADVRKHSATHIFCYISIDRVKNVTDSAGHAAGDALIGQIAEILRGYVKSSRDVVARVSNDDFAILYREKEPGPALDLIKSVRKSIEEYTFVWQGNKFQVSASIGFLLVHKETCTSASQILSDADIASRIAREKGGNRVFIFHPNNEDVLARKGDITWVRRIRDAIKNNMFRLYSQPIHPLAFDKETVPFFHYETLIRLFDENGNQVPPDEFLPSAEQQGMMMEIDKWVVSEALRNLKKITQKKPLPVFSINLSGQSINEPQFLDFVLREIQSIGVNPHMICFEVTESVAVNNVDLAMKFIKSLKELGCSFSLDDFGTGVSSYGYLRELPVDYLKIDGIFVKDLESDPVSQEMVRSINQVGHVMGLEVIAEYVENDEIIRILNEIGVDYGQGYGISRPMPIEDVVRTHC